MSIQSRIVDMVTPGTAINITIRVFCGPLLSSFFSVLLFSSLLSFSFGKSLQDSQENKK